MEGMEIALPLPPVQSNGSYTVTFAVPDSVALPCTVIAPSTVSAPLSDELPRTSIVLSIVDGSANVIEPPDTTIAALLSRLLTDSDPDTATVIPVTLITASSD